MYPPVVEHGRDDAEYVNSGRVQKIFGAMSSNDRMEILRVLNSKGALQFSELKATTGFKTKRESGKFSYHLRTLRKLALVNHNTSGARYGITNLGRWALKLHAQMEEHSIMDSGHIHVRTSQQSIEEFNPTKITNSLVREGRLPIESAQKITDEVEARIHKYKITHLTGPLIRDIANMILIEEGHEDYRNNMNRIGVPAHDVYKMINNTNGGSAKSLMMDVGENVFTEYALSNILPRDVTDMHMRGYIHISNLHRWSLMPDTTFANVSAILNEDWYPRNRMPTGDTTLRLATALQEIAEETSQECVVSGFAQIDIDGSDVYDMLVFMHEDRRGPTISLGVPLSWDRAADVIDAYYKYTRIIPRSRVGLVLDPDGQDIDKFAKSLAAISAQGGSISIYTGQTGSNGITGATPLTSAKMHAVGVNLPRLARESGQDESYLRVKLAMHIDSVTMALENRWKDVSDMTSHGMNPFLKKTLGQNRTESLGITLNLVGLKEAIYDIMGYADKEAHKVAMRVINTAARRVVKNDRYLNLPVTICMSASPGSGRLVELDEARYGRTSVPKLVHDRQYTQGSVIDVRDVSTIDDCIPLNTGEMGEALKGGLQTCLHIHQDTATTDIEESIKSMTGRFGFTIIKHGSS